MDIEGKEYIDFAGGIGVININHCDKEVIKAAQSLRRVSVNSLCFDAWERECKG